jgi:hypothetical protein
MQDEELLGRLEAEIERRLSERFAALRDEFDRLRLESDRRWVGFLERFEQDFSGIVPADMLAERKPEPAPSRGILSLDEARTLDAAANQVETLHRFLEVARRRASRVALLVAKGASLGVWKAVGFSEHGLDDEAVRKVAFTLPDPVLGNVLDGAPSGSFGAMPSRRGSKPAMRWKRSSFRWSSRRRSPARSTRTCCPARNPTSIRRVSRF